MKTLSFLAEQLRDKKLRKTNLRMRVLEGLLRGREPLSVEDLLGFLSQNRLHVHKTSVYRQLDVLEKEKLIRKVQFGEGKQRYEIYPETHHHHFVCTACGQVEDVDSRQDVDRLEARIVKEKGVKIINHSLEFFGLCNTCNR